VVVVVPAGAGHLGGAQAAAYATFLSPDEAEQQRLARFSTVFQAVLARLPQDSAAITSALHRLGAHASSTMTPARLAGVLAGLRSDAVGQQLAFDTVPTRPLDGGTGTTVLVLDSTALPDLLRRGFAGSLPTQVAGAPVRVVLQNGVGTPGLVTKARDKLSAAGLTFVAGGNADRFGYSHSYVFILDTSQQSRQQGQATAHALGLPVSDVTVTDQGQLVADVVVVLGADFKP
jgi:hypothetical protein